jgi:hypothetical protein
VLLCVSFFVETQPRSEKVLFLLLDGNIVAHSIKTGMIIFQMSAIHPRDDDTVRHPQPFLSLKGAIVSLNYHEPCCLHYSERTSHIVVGYSDGAVCFFTFEIPPAEPQSLIPSSTYLLDTNSCHTSPITFLSTIPILDHSSQPLSSWLLVGDSMGTLSIWRVPQAANRR